MGDEEIISFNSNKVHYFSIITVYLILCLTIRAASATSVVSKNFAYLVDMLTTNDPNVTIICRETTEE